MLDKILDRLLDTLIDKLIERLEPKLEDLLNTAVAKAEQSVSDEVEKIPDLIIAALRKVPILGGLI